MLPTYETAESRYGPQMAGILGVPVDVDVIVAATSAFFGRPVPVAEWAVALHPPRDKMVIPPSTTSDQAVAYARVNAGRWIVDCPFCASAQPAAYTDRRYFCADCLNDRVGGAYVPVIWPADRQLVQVEQQLAERPADRFRHWLPGETVRDLQDQDEAAALGLGGQSSPPPVPADPVVVDGPVLRAGAEVEGDA